MITDNLTITDAGLWVRRLIVGKRVNGSGDYVMILRVFFICRLEISYYGFLTYVSQPKNMSTYSSG